MSINHCWRVVAAGITYIVFGVGVFIPVIYMLLLAILPFSEQRRQFEIRKSIKVLARFYMNSLQFLGLMNYYVQPAKSDRPQQLSGHLIICNHSMLIDALFVLAYVDNVCCVVKHQLTINPFTGLIVSMAGYISNSSDDFLGRTQKKLENGENVLIFPEGTRNTFDTELVFKRGAANIAILSQCPVLPMLILPRPRALQRGQKWYQIPKEKSFIHVHMYEPLTLKDCIDTTKPRTIQYRHLTEYWKSYYFSKINQID